jgi:hypothetical protein
VPTGHRCTGQSVVPAHDAVLQRLREIVVGFLAQGTYRKPVGGRARTSKMRGGTATTSRIKPREEGAAERGEPARRQATSRHSLSEGPY